MQHPSNWLVQTGKSKLVSRTDGFLPMYLALSSRRSLASFCRCSDVIESTHKKKEFILRIKKISISAERFA